MQSLKAKATKIKIKRKHEASGAQWPGRRTTMRTSRNEKMIAPKELHGNRIQPNRKAMEANGKKWQQEAPEEEEPKEIEEPESGPESQMAPSTLHILLQSPGPMRSERTVETPCPRALTTGESSGSSSSGRRSCRRSGNSIHSKNPDGLSGTV